MSQIFPPHTNVEALILRLRETGYKYLMVSDHMVLICKVNPPCFSDSGYYEGAMLDRSCAVPVLCQAIDRKLPVRLEEDGTAIY